MKKVAMVFGFGIVLSSMIYLVFLGSLTCDKSVLETLESPNKKWLAVRYNLSCDALAGSSNITIVKAPYELFLLTLYEADIVTDFDYENQISFQWTDESSLLTKIPRNLKIYRQNRMHDSVRFSLEFK